MTSPWRWLRLPPCCFHVRVSVSASLCASDTELASALQVSHWKSHSNVKRLCIPIPLEGGRWLKLLCHVLIKYQSKCVTFLWHSVFIIIIIIIIGPYTIILRSLIRIGWITINLFSGPPWKCTIQSHAHMHHPPGYIVYRSLFVIRTAFAGLLPGVFGFRF